MTSTPPKFYHVFPASAEASIRLHGLIPSVGNRSQKLDEHPGIFLWSSRDEMEDGVCNWLGDEFGDDEPLLCAVLNLPENISRIQDPDMPCVTIATSLIPPSCFVDFFDV